MKKRIRELALALLATVAASIPNAPASSQEPTIPKTATNPIPRAFMQPIPIPGARAMGRAAASSPRPAHRRTARARMPARASIRASAAAALLIVNVGPPRHDLTYAHPTAFGPAHGYDYTYAPPRY